MSDNFKITKNNIKEILESMHDQIETALTECGMDAESYAKKECPVDTGRLRNSITFSTEVGESEALMIVGTNVEYAQFVEDGTSRMSPRPYLKPAIADHKSHYMQVIKRNLQE